MLQRVGVIGAGVIGRGVAQSLAQTGHTTVVIDDAPAALDQARVVIERDVRMHHLISNQGEPLDRAKVMSRLRFGRDLEALSECEFVIENITESWEAKQRLYRALSDVVDPGCILAANTSVIPITRIAGVVPNPSRVVGLHFMNPVPLKSVVEAIRGADTSDETVATTEVLLGQMEKRAIWVKDSPGFVSNRILMLTINEASAVVEEGVASAGDVDAVFQGCFGHPMGPLATADLIGIDTIVHSLDGLVAETGSDRFQATAVLRGMVDDGRLGRKSGEGFHVYRGAMR